MKDETNHTQQEATIQVTCPHCKKAFWAKFGHVLKEVGTFALEAGVGGIVSNLGAFKED